MTQKPNNLILIVPIKYNFPPTDRSFHLAEQYRTEENRQRPPSSSSGNYYNSRAQSRKSARRAITINRSASGNNNSSNFNAFELIQVQVTFEVNYIRIG